jgi:hypothetical protein
VVLPRVTTDGKYENNPLFFKHMGKGVPSKKEVFMDRTLHFLPFREWMRSFHDNPSKKPFLLSMYSEWYSISATSFMSCTLCLDISELKSSDQRKHFKMGKMRKILFKKIGNALKTDGTMKLSEIHRRTH